MNRRVQLIEFRVYPPLITRGGGIQIMLSLYASFECFQIILLIHARCALLNGIASLSLSVFPPAACDFRLTEPRKSFALEGDGPPRSVDNRSIQRGCEIPFRFRSRAPPPAYVPHRGRLSHLFPEFFAIPK
ncbi:hypothetical protein FRB94_014771 [Tulasnella sp. JGI-2019a]|nr:hypothetical protein FRB94_014771 [Tulasnella sp. JGI-2019a]